MPLRPARRRGAPAVVAVEHAGAAASIVRRRRSMPGSSEPNRRLDAGARGGVGVFRSREGVAATSIAGVELADHDLDPVAVLPRRRTGGSRARARSPTPTTTSSDRRELERSGAAARRYSRRATRDDVAQVDGERQGRHRAAAGAAALAEAGEVLLLGRPAADLLDEDLLDRWVVDQELRHALAAVERGAEDRLGVDRLRRRRAPCSPGRAGRRSRRAGRPATASWCRRRPRAG